ncbi:uncharacterized protein LOC133189226 [Saccostrea echinata]|uniref:uncharacterized protein LOC133189226 n=1 Tax=Saccostrea echinata TaxID=191078 RepID=UPI002A7FD1D7|nr:uncharacterized protein LOC133189226 [Saccostrea echinata]
MWLEAITLIFVIHYVSKTSSFVNLAHTPTQSLQGSASWNLSPHAENWTADKAVDGNINQTYVWTCAISNYNKNYKMVWWKRTGAQNRATGFSIYIYNDKSFFPSSGYKDCLVYHHDPMSGCPVSMYNITVNKLAQGVAFFNERPVGFTSNCVSAEVTKTSVEICEVRVMGCDPNRYHFGCSGACSVKCKESHCDAFNGSCIYGCSNPNAVFLNCIVCDDGMYAFNGGCIQCGHCKDDRPCDKRTGSCSSGCKENWTGDLCKECIDGFYDQDCSTKCGECRSKICDKRNGSCLNGCKTNWKEPLCLECSNGMYDQKCSTRCGLCLEGFCDKKNGSCLSECKLNWKEPLCQECVDGFHDEDCSRQCGYCLEGFCDKKNGTCLNGCVGNWQGPLCQVHTTREPRTGDNEFSKTSLVVISVISTLLGVFLLSTLIIVVYIKRTRCLQNNVRENSINDHLSRKDTEQKYDELKGGKEDHHYTSIGSTNRESTYQEIHTYRNSEFNDVMN